MSSASLLGLVTVVVLAGLLVWTLRDVMGQRPRFLRLAHVITGAGMSLVGIGIGFAVFAVAFGSGGSVGSPVGAGRDGVRVTAPMGFQWGRTDDTQFTQMVRREFGRGAHVGQSNEVEITVAKPSAALWVGAATTIGLGFGLVFTVLLLVRRILWRTLIGDPFDPSNLRGLRWLAAVVFFGSIAKGGADFFIASAAIRETGGRSGVFWPGPVLWPTLVAILILGLSEIWRHGIALQRDVEATV